MVLLLHRIAAILVLPQKGNSEGSRRSVLGLVVAPVLLGVGKDSGQKLTDRCMHEQSSRAHNNRLRN
jgi:hypothetical protein